MAKLFFPTYYFDRAYDITPQFLRREGIDLILSDLDDTLTCHDDPTLSPAYAQWIAALAAEGIGLRILSNNSEERTRPFCQKNGLCYTAHARKPLPGGARRALSELGVDPARALILGDQIFTDILCGAFSGIRTAAVAPIGSRATRFIAFKRVLERPIWRAYFARRRKEEA